MSDSWGKRAWSGGSPEDSHKRQYTDEVPWYLRDDGDGDGTNPYATTTDPEQSDIQWPPRSDSYDPNDTTDPTEWNTTEWTSLVNPAEAGGFEESGQRRVSPPREVVYDTLDPNELPPYTDDPITQWIVQQTQPEPQPETQPEPQPEPQPAPSTQIPVARPRTLKAMRDAASTIQPLVLFPPSVPGDYTVPGNFMLAWNGYKGPKDVLSMIRDSILGTALSQQTYSTMKQRPDFAEQLNAAIQQSCKAMLAEIGRKRMTPATTNFNEQGAFVLPAGYDWSVGGEVVHGPYALAEQDVWQGSDDVSRAYVGVNAERKKVMATIERIITAGEPTLFQVCSNIDYFLTNVKWETLLSSESMFPAISHINIYPWAASPTVVKVVEFAEANLQSYLQTASVQQKIKAIIMTMDLYKKLVYTNRCVLEVLDPLNIGLVLDEAGEVQNVYFISVMPTTIVTITKSRGGQTSYDYDAAAFFLAGLLQLILLCSYISGAAALKDTGTAMAWDTTLRSAISSWMAQNFTWLGVYWERLRNWYRHSGCGVGQAHKPAMNDFEEFLIELILPLQNEDAWKEWKPADTVNAYWMRKQENAEAAMMVRRAFSRIFWNNTIPKVFDRNGRNWTQNPKRYVPVKEELISVYGYTHEIPKEQDRCALVRELLEEYIQEIAAPAPVERLTRSIANLTMQ